MIDTRLPNWYDKISYRYFRRFRSRLIRGVIGLDSEAYLDGKPFMICMSDGTTFHHCDDTSPIPAIFKYYKNFNIVVYNLKYDSGAILYTLPNNEKEELWIRTETRHGPYTITYIPHISLTIRKGKDRVRIWDIAQFFQTSLDNAASKYLGRRKIHVETKSFTREYVKENFDQLQRYCVRDAELTAALGNYFLEKLKEFGIRPTSLFSQASLSFQFYSDKGKIITCKRFFEYWPEMLRYSMESYEGGKFEVTSRGAFTGFEYDLVSAYPSAIRNLVDISHARVKKSKRYQPSAQYGFIRVKIYNPKGLHLPCGILRGNLRVYPAGEYYCTITKIEYEYLKKLKIRCPIDSAWWLFVDKKKKYPYKKTTDFLFSLKKSFKGKDDMLYSLTKIMLNGFYGKTCQMIEDYTGKYVCGTGFNPIYASQITAETRVKISKIQNLLGKNCLAVHTDSCISTSPLPKKLVTGKLGQMDFVCEGKGVLIACGQYVLASEAAYKGFEPLKDENWWELLEENKRRSHFFYPIIKVESWIESIAKGHFNKINLFTKEKKKIDLNGDSKRVWINKAKGGDLLKKLEYSYPVVIVEKEKPESWKP